MADRQLTDKQKAGLKQFTDLIGDVRNPDHGERDLLRWLQAKAWNPKKAEDMYRKNEKWRKDLEVDKMVTEYKEPEVMTKYYSGGVVGKDAEGNFIRVDPSGRNDVKGFMRSTKKDDLTKTIIARIERTLQSMREYRQAHGRTGDQVIQIIDMSGFKSNMDSSVIYFYLETMTILDNHYPGILKKAYIINVPSIFKMAWNFMKRFLSKELVDTFELFDSGWEARLQADLPVDQIPVAYGGTMRDPDGDETCKSLVNYGGEVPKSYYRTVESCLPPESSTTEHVGRADILKVETKVTQTPAVLGWVFASEGNPLKFGIYREKTPGRRELDALEQMVAVREVDSHVIPEDGTLVCEVPGTYFLVFDNRSSRFTRRKVTYQFKVEDTPCM